MFNINIITKYSNEFKKRYIIQKNSLYFKISKPPKLDFNKNNTEIFDKKFNDYITTFITFLKTKSNINLNLFYENLKTLVIKEKRNFNKFFFIKTATKGYYHAYSNKIWVLKDDNLYGIYHELLHCASRKCVDNKLMVGFHTFVFDEKKTTTNIGRGLTEGYTSLLENRYFGSIKHNKKNGYEIEEFISSFLETIVEKDQMEQLYFNADLQGLINYLKQFSNEDDILTFLTYLDEICKGKKKKLTPKFYKTICEFIAVFLLKTYIVKLIILLQNNVISRDQFKILFNEYTGELSSYAIFDKKNTYFFLTKELTNKILDEVNEDLDNNNKIRLHI